MEAAVDDRPRPRPVGAAFARRPVPAAQAVTVKQQGVIAGDAPVFVRIDVTASTPADADAELARAFRFARAQLIGLQMAEKELAEQTLPSGQKGEGE